MARLTPPACPSSEFDSAALQSAVQRRGREFVQFFTNSHPGELRTSPAAAVAFFDYDATGRGVQSSLERTRGYTGEGKSVAGEGLDEGEVSVVSPHRVPGRDQDRGSGR